MNVIVVFLAVLHLSCAASTLDKPADFTVEGKLILQSDAFWKIQRYVSTILDLRAPSYLKGEDGYNVINHYTTNAADHARVWYNTIFPKTVGLGASISSYSTAIKAIFTRISKTTSVNVFSKDGLTQMRAIMELKAMLNRLEKICKINSAAVEKLFPLIKTFKNELTDDEYYEQKLMDDYGKKGQDANMRNLRNQIQEQAQKLNDITKEYERQVLIESRVPYYSWVPVVGWVVGKAVTGVSGRKQRQLQQQRREVIEELTKLEKQLDKKAALVTFVSTHLNNVKSALGAIDPVDDILRKLAFSWKDVCNELSLLMNTNTLNTVDPQKDMFPFKVNDVLQAWAKLKMAADKYRGTAYISKESKPALG